MYPHIILILRSILQLGQKKLLKAINVQCMVSKVKKI